MKNHYLKFLFFIFIVSSLASYGQSSQIQVKFIGNCGLYLTDGKLNLYIDFPYKSGAHHYMEYDKAELDSIPPQSIFLFTHRHSDHYSKKLVKKLDGEVYGNWNTEKLNKLNNNHPDFSVKAMKTPHKFTLKHYSYIITWHGKQLYISGDTGDLDAVSQLKNIDWAFISPWLYTNAYNEKVKIDAKQFGIYHLYPNQKVTGELPDNLVLLRHENQTIYIPY